MAYERTQLVPIEIRKIASKVSSGEKLSTALRELGIAPMTFFDHLDRHPEDALAFRKARMVAVEGLLDEADDLLSNAVDKLDLEKAKAQVSFRSWLAEKLIPTTYGSKLDVTVTTIDLKEVIAEANKRLPQKPPTIEIEQPSSPEEEDIENLV